MDDNDEAALGEAIMGSLGEEHEDAMRTYVMGEPRDVQMLRRREQGEFPWPLPDNPMLKYLIERANAGAEDDGTESGLIWLAVHAWFEGALAALSTKSDEEPDVDRETIFAIMRQLGVTEQTAKVHESEARGRMARARRKMIERDSVGE